MHFSLLLSNFPTDQNKCSPPISCNSLEFSSSKFNTFILLHGKGCDAQPFIETADGLQRYHHEGTKVKKTNPDAKCWLFASPLHWNVDFIDCTYICYPIFPKGIEISSFIQQIISLLRIALISQRLLVPREKRKEKAYVERLQSSCVCSSLLPITSHDPRSQEESVTFIFTVKTKPN